MSPDWGIKDFTFHAWSGVCQLQDREFVESQDDPEFLRTVSQFGDLSEPEAWESAFSALQAENYLREDEPQFLIERLIHDSKTDGWRSLLACVVSRVLARPQGLEKVHEGLIELRESGWMLGEADAEGLAIFQEMAIADRPDDQVQALERRILQNL